MIRKFGLITAVAVMAVATVGDVSAAEKKYGPGVTDTEIKLGQTVPYSGPASAFSSYGRVMTGYFKMVNEAGGINGRKINLISLDNAFSPPKAIEQTRKLVEDDGVLADARYRRHDAQCRDPEVSERRQGAAHLRFRRWPAFRRSAELPLDCADVSGL